MIYVLLALLFRFALVLGNMGVMLTVCSPLLAVAVRKQCAGDRPCGNDPHCDSPADDARCEVIGGGHRVPPAGLPIEQVFGEYSLSFLRRDVALFVSTRARDSF